MKDKILSILRGAEGFVSGQELCEQLNVSRTAVWKAIGRLKEEGYKIQAVRNKGYSLDGIPDLLTEQEINEKLETKWAARTIESYDRLTSTNVRARELGEAGGVHGLLVTADLQTAGKGRFGRSWVNDSGTNIAMSLLLRPEISPSSASMLTLAAALSVVAGIKEETGVETGIKWPNDIVADGRKVCGILTEMSSDMDGIRYVVVGIGINVNNREFPEELNHSAISLYRLAGRVFYRGSLAASVMKWFEYYYEIFMKTQNLTGLMNEYNEKLVNVNRGVRVHGLKESYTGIALGINKEGELLVETDDGKVKKVSSGEVSVRGIYEYI